MSELGQLLTSQRPAKCHERTLMPPFRSAFTQNAVSQSMGCIIRVPVDFELRENCHLSVLNGGKPVDAVDVETTWESLVSRPGAQLIDVRARAEWTYVGIPDLGAIGKRAVLVGWQTFRDQTVDPRFVERLAGELKVLGAHQLGKCRVSSQ